MRYNLDLGGMKPDRIYELIDKGLAYEQAKCGSCPLISGVFEALCGKCEHDPMSRGCLIRTACPKRGAMKRIYEVLEEQGEIENER